MKKMIISLFSKNPVPLSKHLPTIKRLSTLAVSSDVQESPPILHRTSEQDPSKHTIDQVGLLYTMPFELARTELFPYAILPRVFETRCGTILKEYSIMIRKPALEIMHYLKNVNLNNPAQKLVIYIFLLLELDGRPGIGKTTGLAHILHYGYTTGWLLVYVPSVGNWLTDARGVVDSLMRPGYKDHPIMALKWLRVFKCQNLKLIQEKDLKVLNDHVWNAREETKSGSPFVDLIDFGLNRTPYCSAVIGVILEEIKQYAKDERIKILLAIDGYNALYHEVSEIKEGRTAHVPNEKVTIFDDFLRFSKGDWNNGAAIFVVDQLATVGRSESDFPLYQLTLKGFHYLDPFIPVRYEKLSRVECIHLLNYYKEKRWIHRGDYGELYALSAGNPEYLTGLCDTL